MTHSLTLKLVRAFLVISITGAVLAAVLARWMMVREFNQLIFDQTQSNFIDAVSAYYQINGSWEGVMDYIQWRAREQPPPQPQPPQLRPQPNPPDTRQPLAPAFVFMLADQDGIVVVPAASYRLGDHVPDAELAQGEPVAINGQVVGTVLPTGDPPPLAPREEGYLASTNQALFYAALGATAIALVLGVFLARSLSRPLRELTTAARAMAAGDLEQEVPVRSSDELGELTAAFNQMSADLAHANQLRRQMTADIAHDLRTPLTVIAGYIESMQEGVLAATPARLQTIYREVEHLQHLVADLRTLARADAGELTLNLQPMPPRALLQRAANTFWRQAEQQQISLQVEAAADLPAVRVDEERMAQVLGNLVSNALRYTAAQGTIRLAATASDGQVRLVVADDGGGIAPEHLPHVFRRFYRADEARRGKGSESGLGLAIVKSLVEAHGGQIAVASAGVDKGTTFTISLPA